MNTELKDEVRDLAVYALDMGCMVRLMDLGSSRVPQAYVTVSLDSLRGVSRNGDTVVEITSADGGKRRFMLDVALVEASSGPFDSAAADVDGSEAAVESLEYDEAAAEIEGMLSDGAKIVVREVNMFGDVVNTGDTTEWTQFLQDCVDCKQVILSWKGW